VLFWLVHVFWQPWFCIFYHFLTFLQHKMV
jgi:hypothetical protein